MQRSNYEVNVGLFALGAMVLLLLGWAWLKSFSLFTQPQRFVAEFSDVAGLNRNATVNIQGVRVGTVDAIEFVNDKSDPARNKKIDVHIKVTDTSVGVPEGSHISIQTLGMVGAKYIEISLPRDAAGNVVGGRLLGPDDVLKPPFVEEPVRTELALNHIASRVEDIVGSIDPQATGQAISNFSQATQKLNKNMDKLRDAATSVAHASDNIATTSEKFGQTASNATAASQKATAFFTTGDQTLHNISDLASEFKGTSHKLNKLLDNPALSGDMKETMTQARQTAETVRTMMNELSTTLKDKEMREQVLGMLTRMQQSTENIKTSMEVVNRLSSDPTLRNDVKDVIGKAKDALTQANNILSDPSIKGNVGKTLTSVRCAAGNVDIASRQLQQVLNKRSPLLQLLFRRPGKLKECPITPEGCPPSPASAP